MPPACALADTFLSAFCLLTHALSLSLLTLFACVIQGTGACGDTLAAMAGPHRGGPDGHTEAQSRGEPQNRPSRPRARHHSAHTDVSDTLSFLCIVGLDINN